MTLRFLGAAGAAIALACTAACSNGSSAPLTPASPSINGAGALPDGSTLKVTAPEPVFPSGGVEVDTSDPTFSVNNASARFGDAPSIEYRFEVHTEGGAFVSNSHKIPAGDGATSWDFPSSLEMGSYKWRARAEMGTNYGPWSEFVAFTITAPPSILPPGPYPTEPFAIAKFVENSYPERTRARVSLGQRKEDMAFLRDRIIEVGLCVGLEMGRNLKRGGPEHSIDFLAWRTNGKTWGVDIAGGYDDTSERLRLGWHMHAPRAFFDPLPNPERCRN